MRKIVILFSLLMLFRILYCESIPIVSSPIEIKNYVNFYDSNDFAIYKLYILNPTEINYEYNILTVSVDWLILYGKDDSDRFGAISPGQIKEITVYLRPKKIQVQAPMFIISFKSDKEDVTYKNTIILNPRINYEKIERVSVVLQEVEIIPEKIKKGEAFSAIIKIYNPNFFDVEIPVLLYTSYGYRKEINAFLTSGTNIIKVDSVVPSSITSENFTLMVIVENKTIEKPVNLLTETQLPIVEQKEKYILIQNPYDTYIYYEFELPYSKFDLIFFKLFPKPYEYILRDGKIYARWKIVLLPKEEYIIKKTINYYSILVILIILILFITFLILILQPKIEIRKEVIRFSPEDKIMRVAIYIKNRGLLSLNNVIIRDRILEIFKINKYDTAEPVGVYKEGKETILEWSYDKIKPKEEIILSYTLTFSEELPKVINIPNATIYYNHLFGEKIETSNRVSISIVK